MVDREHQGRERTFQRGMLIEIVDDDFRIGIALELDHDARAFVRLIADIADVGEHFFVHQLRDSLDQRCAVHTVGNLGDDNLFSTTFEFFHAGLATHLQAAATGLDILSNPAHAADHAASWAVRPLHAFHQMVEGDSATSYPSATSTEELSAA